MKKVLTPNKFFDAVRDHVIRAEFQGMKTVHIHVAAWVVTGLDLSGRTGEKQSTFLHLLEAMFHSKVDVQHGSGFLNYINGYVVKGHGTMDYQPDAASSGGECHAVHEYPVHITHPLTSLTQSRRSLIH